MNIEKFKGYLKSKKISIPVMASNIGLTKQSMYLKLAGERDFRASELGMIAEYIPMTTEEILDIFFDRKVTVNDNK